MIDLRFAVAAKRFILPIVVVLIAGMGRIISLDIPSARSVAMADITHEAPQVQVRPAIEEITEISVPAGLADEPLRILLLGDSITQSDMYHLGYRYYLWTKLVDSGINFDFVGQMESHYGADPELPEYKGRQFDRDHEGHPGWESICFLNGAPGKGNDNLSVWLNQYTPDIVLLHVGTCDIIYGNSISSAIDNIEQIIEILRVKNPNVVILLAKLIPMMNREDRIAEINAEIERLAAREGSSDSPIILVDHNTGFDPYNDLFDRVHPNIYGNMKMAAKWFDALKSVIEEGRVQKRGV
jgi:hypothetical protein